jgi:hypothetical protein
VLMNGLALHFGGLEFPFPVGKRYKSFQTRSGLANILKFNWDEPCGVRQVKIIQR